MLKGLVGVAPISSPVEASFRTIIPARALYVGERAWCSGLYDPIWSEDWDRGPSEIVPERAPCVKVAVRELGPETDGCEGRAA